MAYVYVYDATKGGGVFAKLPQTVCIFRKDGNFVSYDAPDRSAATQAPYSPLCTTRRDILNM